MRLEIFGSLFAMLLSLFVTMENNSPSPLLTLRGGTQENLPLKISPIERGEGGQRCWGHLCQGVIENFSSINAQSAFIGCLCDSPPLYAKNFSTQSPLASVTKIMTAYLALRELGPDYLVTISNEAVATEGIAGDLQAGERLTIKDLVTMAMTYSSNDAAMALAEALGLAQGASNFSDAIARTVFSMNENAFALGMRHTFFQNPTGLDLPRMESNGLPAGLPAGQAGPSNFSTAEDWAILLKATTAQPLLWDLARDPTPRVISADGITHELINLNPFRSFPHYVGGKTGTTDLAGENMVMLFEKPLGKVHALILFGAPPGQREQEAQKLLDWVASL